MTQVWGYMGIDLVDRTRMWTNEDYQWFSSLANVISICIELRKTKDEAVRERTFLSNLFRYMPLGYVRMSIVCDEKDNPYGYYVTDANSILPIFWENLRRRLSARQPRPFQGRRPPDWNICLR